MTERRTPRSRSGTDSRFAQPMYGPEGDLRLSEERKARREEQQLINREELLTEQSRRLQENNRLYEQQSRGIQDSIRLQRLYNAQAEQRLRDLRGTGQNGTAALERQVVERRDSFALRAADRALGVRDRLDDPKTTADQAIRLRAQLRELTGQPDAKAVDLLRERQRLETQSLANRRQLSDSEERTSAASLRAEQERNRLQQYQREQQAKLRFYRAKQDEATADRQTGQAQLALDYASTPRDKEIAQRRLDNARLTSQQAREAASFELDNYNETLRGRSSLGELERRQNEEQALRNRFRGQDFDLQQQELRQRQRLELIDRGLPVEQLQSRPSLFDDPRNIIPDNWRPGARREPDSERILQSLLQAINELPNKISGAIPSGQFPVAVNYGNPADVRRAGGG